MRRIVGVAAIAICLGLVAANAGAQPNAPSPVVTLISQTDLILGYNSSYTGNVMIWAGAQPLNGGLPYYDEDGVTVVMGPDIPHYSEAGDPLYHVGDATMNVFTAGQEVHAGSGMFVQDGLVYDGTFVFAGPSRTVTQTESFTGEGGYWMTWLGRPADGPDGSCLFTTAADIGQWTLTETWTNHENSSDTITFAKAFEVVGNAPVPEPVTMFSAFMGLGSLGMYIRKRIQRQAAA